MTISFKNVTKETQDLKQAYFNAVQNGESPEVIEAKHSEYMSSWGKDLTKEIMADARAERDKDVDKQVMLARGKDVLTNEEEKFFMNLIEHEGDLDTYKEEKLLPQTFIERVFEDLQEARPLLSKIKFQNTGLRAKVITGDPEGQAVWGEIFGRIKGQIDANFKEVSFVQNKLTAFAIVPKDLIEFGPTWIARYVRIQLAEAVGAKLEEAIINGAGAAKNEPIGLLYNVITDKEAGTISIGDKKAVQGQLTFANTRTIAKELALLTSRFATKENGKSYNASGKVSIIANPEDAPLIEAFNTVQAPNGQWVTSLPFNVDVVPSVYAPKKKVIAFVPERYVAAYTGAVDIKEYDQTLALEDANVYIAKQFAHGFPEDNKVAEVYDLAIDLDTTDVETL